MHINEVITPEETHMSPNGREFRTISIEQIPNSQKWMNGAYKSLFKLLVKMKDNNEFIWLYFDYNDILTKRERHEP